MSAPATSREALPQLEGSHDHTVDGKGRVSIPAVFRTTLKLSEADEVVVTRGIRRRCLFVYTPESWEVFKALIPTYPPRVQDALRRVVRGSARRAKIDRLGRIQLPQVLRGPVALDGKCLVVGQGTVMEIWALDEWNEAFGYDADVLTAAELELMNYG